MGRVYREYANIPAYFDDVTVMVMVMVMGAVMMMVICKRRHQWKKTFSFGHCPNHLPPPLTPIRATWSFFWTSKTTFCAYDQIFFYDDNDGFNDNYDDNFGNFDDNYDKND